ncbi:PAS domain-containing protein [Xanthobacter sp. KR7-65]|uniref:PAS domain-containing protein n=1 Tax=Xanthobacter sp. KR7-65 TaxID=3156612 RepID=UPI0032B472F4
MSKIGRADPDAAKAALDELRALAGPLFAAMAATGTAVVVTNPRLADDPIIYANAAFEALSGYAIAEVLGRNSRFLQTEETDPTAVAEIAAALDANAPVVVDLLNRRRDGSSFWNRVSITPLRDASGAAMFRLGTHTDVSGEHADASVAEELRLSRMKLAEARERLRVAQAIAGAAGAWEWDIASGVFFADVRFANLYGLDPAAAAQGLPVSEFFAPVHEEDRLRLRIAVAAALNGAEVFARDFRVVTEGKVHWVSARGRTYLDAEDRPVRFSGVLADITDQKRVEEQLRIAQTAGGVGSYEYLSGFGTAEVSEQFCFLLGLQPTSSLPIRTINALVHPDDPLLVQAHDDRLKLGPMSQETRVRRADTGEERWLISRGEYRPGEAGGIRFIGVIYDITTIKRSEEQLRLLAETLELRVAARTEERDRVWRLSRDLLQVVGPDGLYRAVNPAWATVLGYTEAEIVGLRPDAFVHPDDRHLIAAQTAARTAREASADFDCRMRAKDGTYRWINWTAMPEGDTVYGIGRDVTQRKALEEQLRQSQKMEAVGQLTGGLAHDFNNMLTGILGGIEMVRRRIGQGKVDDVDRILEAVTHSGQRAAALIHRLLAFSRQQTLDSRPIDVSVLLASIDDLLRRTLGEQTLLTVEIDPHLWRAVADENQLESAILNLAINARDAMPEGGTLSITARNTHLFEADLLASDRAEAGDYVEIRVEDTGTGMPPDVLAKVFDPFYTTKPVGQGTGLGLSMIYGFVQQSRGHVTIESSEGRGTAIRLFLPRDVGEQPKVELSSPPVTVQGSGETVLVVEDDVGVRLLVVQLLHELGYITVEAPDGREALAILNSPQHFDLMISDVGLPGLNGRQLADMAREGRPDLPVLFMTGYSQKAADQAQFLDHGMGIISKPFEVGQFSRRVAEIVSRKQK